MLLSVHAPSLMGTYLNCAYIFSTHSIIIACVSCNRYRILSIIRLKFTICMYSEFRTFDGSHNLDIISNITDLDTSMVVASVLHITTTRPNRSITTKAHSNLIATMSAAQTHCKQFTYLAGPKARTLLVSYQHHHLSAPDQQVPVSW